MKMKPCDCDFDSRAELSGIVAGSAEPATSADKAEEEISEEDRLPRDLPFGD